MFEAILNPRETFPVSLCEHESPESYLRKCHQNILAEMWALFETKVLFPRWRDQNMEKFFFVGYEGTVVTVFEDSLHKKPKEASDFQWTLVVWENRLYLLLPKREAPGMLILKPGKQLTDMYDSGSPEFFHVVGFMHPYYAELGAIQELLQLRGKNDMLVTLANPCNRCPFPFCGGEGCEFSEKVPINERQRTIIEMMDRNLECIQGPPGTGKSTTIFHIVQTAVPAGYHAIITCVQNKALDSIAEKLGQTDMCFIVFGNPSRLGDCARRFTLAAQVARDPEVLRVEKEKHAVDGVFSLIEKRMELIEAGKSRNGWMCLWRAWVRRHHEVYLALNKDADRLNQMLSNLFTELANAKMAAEAVLKETSRASLSTMDGLASAQIGAPRSVVIIDEAGTVPEYKLPLLLTMRVEAIVAIGDQNQLQPFSQARQNQLQPFSQARQNQLQPFSQARQNQLQPFSQARQNQLQPFSQASTLTPADKPMDGFFQRAVKSLGGGVPMLTEQYRMHPAICELVSDQFYRNRLVTDETVAALRLSVPGGIEWRDYPDLQAESPDKTKKWNPVEVDMLAAFMCDELPALLREGKSVAVITFYKQQFLKLMQVGQDAQTVKSREEMKGGKPGDTRFVHHNFRIVTVDAAQGSEADVVVLSCVRCNRHQSLGFITDKNRLCVALSRARERLIVVGSKATLCAVDLVWRAVAHAACE